MKPGADALDRVPAGLELLAGFRCVMTGLLTGSTATIFTVGLRDFEHFAHAGDRAAGADAGDEDVDLAVGVAPDFLGRGLAMDFGIGRVLELLRHEVVLVLGHQFLGPADRAGHALGRRASE